MPLNKFNTFPYRRIVFIRGICLIYINNLFYFNVKVFNITLMLVSNVLSGILKTSCEATGISLLVVIIYTIRCQSQIQQLIEL